MFEIQNKTWKTLKSENALNCYNFPQLTVKSFNYTLINNILINVTIFLSRVPVTYFMLLVFFCTHWRHQRITGFPTFSGVGRGQWHERVVNLCKKSGFFKACVRYFLWNFYFFTKWYPFKNYEKCFLFHLKSSFRSRDI